MGEVTRLPTRKPGRQSAKAAVQYELELSAFAELVEELASGAVTKLTVRGLMYILENSNVISKEQFDEASTLLGKLRKEGLIPWDLVEEEAREIDGQCYRNIVTPQQYVEMKLSQLLQCHTYYTPVLLWDNQDYCPLMMVEKIDLKLLFDPVVREYQVPITSNKGWSSITLRCKTAAMFKEAEEERGKTPVILYCGDFDPIGLQMSELIHQHFDDLFKATGWHPDNLVVDRFGLNKDYIERHGIPWVPMDIKTKVDKEDIAKVNAYTRAYIAQHGPRKCEANALVVRPEAARQLALNAILSLINQDRLSEYRNALDAAQAEVRELMQTAYYAAVGDY